MKKNLPPARVMMSSTIFRFVYPNRERERERETLLVYCWPLGSIGMKFVTHPAPCWRTAHLVTLQQTDIKKKERRRRRIRSQTVKASTSCWASAAAGPCAGRDRAPTYCTRSSALQREIFRATEWCVKHSTSYPTLRVIVYE